MTADVPTGAKRWGYFPIREVVVDSIIVSGDGKRWVRLVSDRYVDAVAMGDVFMTRADAIEGAKRVILDEYSRAMTKIAAMTEAAKAKCKADLAELEREP